MNRYMKLKRCRCRMCNYGIRRPRGEFIMKSSKRKYRHQFKQMLKLGLWEDLPEAISIPYTD